MAETGGMGGPGAFLAAEIASQPDCWRRAAGLAGDLRALLPAGRISLAGCGTSAYVAQAAAVHWETAGLGEADAFAASEMPAGRSYDTVVVVSRSGTTTEVAALLHRLGEARTVAVVGDAAGPVARAATHHLALGFADERSVVQTRFATSVVALFRALAGDDVGPPAAAAAEALERPVPVPAGADRFVFLGTGAAIGLAHEAALKLREAALTVTESYPAMEYRHGPIAIAGPGVVVWVLGTPPAGLVDDVRRTGATVVDDDLDPLADLVRVQALALARARAAGLDPDRPRHLTRAVHLPAAGDAAQPGGQAAEQSMRTSGTS